MTTFKDLPGYETEEELFAAETNGFVALFHCRENTPKRPRFTQVFGPFGTQREAENARARGRRLWKRSEGDPTRPSDLLRTEVRRIWKNVP